MWGELCLFESLSLHSSHTARWSSGHVVGNLVGGVNCDVISNLQTCYVILINSGQDINLDVFNRITMYI